MRVTVVGAGVAGLVTAIHLAERGAEVDVLERGAQLGDGACTWAAGGMIAPWCEAETGEEEAARLGPEALDWWPRQISEVFVEGTLVVASKRDQAELSRFSGRTDHFEWANAERVAALEPDLAGRFDRGLFFSEEAHVDPRAALPALQRRLESLGGRVTFGVSAAPDKIDADAVVDCRGIAARDTLKDLRGVRGEMLLLRTEEVTLSRPIRLLHPRIALYVIPRADHVFMVGATAIESGSRAKISARSAVELINGAYAVHPAFGEAEIVETCADVRPSFPDNMPRVTRDGCVVRLNGLFRNGFLLSPTYARLATDAVFELESSREADRQRLAS